MNPAPSTSSGRRSGPYDLRRKRDSSSSTPNNSASSSDTPSRTMPLRRCRLNLKRNCTTCCRPSIDPRSLTGTPGHIATRQTPSTSSAEYPTSTSRGRVSPAASTRLQKIPTHIVTINSRTETPSYKCLVCKRAWKTKKHWKYHKHCGKRQNKEYKCRLCSRIFIHKQHYNYHVTTKGCVGKPFKCQRCSKCFRKQKGWIQHQSKCERNYAMYQVPQTPQSGALAQRETNGIQTKNVFSCPECHLKTKSEIEILRHLLSRHVASETSEKRPFHCNQPRCRKKFTKYATLVLHLMGAHHKGIRTRRKFADEGVIKFLYKKFKISGYKDIYKYRTAKRNLPPPTSRGRKNRQNRETHNGNASRGMRWNSNRTKKNVTCPNNNRENVSVWESWRRRRLHNYLASQARIAAGHQEGERIRWQMEEPEEDYPNERNLADDDNDVDDVQVVPRGEEVEGILHPYQNGGHQGCSQNEERGSPSPQLQMFVPVPPPKAVDVNGRILHVLGAYENLPSPPPQIDIYVNDNEVIDNSNHLPIERQPPRNAVIMEEPERVNEENPVAPAIGKKSFFRKLFDFVYNLI